MESKTSHPAVAVLRLRRPLAALPSPQAAPAFSPCTAEISMADAVPLPPQYEPQPLVDFRHQESGPRGFKVGVSKTGKQSKKRKLEEYEAQVELEEEQGMQHMGEGEQQPEQQRIGAVKKPKLDTTGVGKVSGAAGEVVGQHACADCWPIVGAAAVTSVDQSCTPFCSTPTLLKASSSRLPSPPCEGAAPPRPAPPAQVSGRAWKQPAMRAGAVMKPQVRSRAFVAAPSRSRLRAMTSAAGPGPTGSPVRPQAAGARPSLALPGAAGRASQEQRQSSRPLERSLPAAPPFPCVFPCFALAAASWARAGRRR